MAESICEKPSVLTEDMIDAAMSKRLKDLSEGLSVNDKEKEKNDHDYDDEYSSDSDYQVESIDASNDSQEESSLVENRIDGNESGSNDSQEESALVINEIDCQQSGSNDLQEENALVINEIDCKSGSNDLQEESTLVINEMDGRQSGSNDSQEDSTLFNNKIDGKKSTSFLPERSENTVENGHADECNTNRISVISPSKISKRLPNNKATVLNAESANLKVESNVKKGLIIKPLTNLLKADVIQGKDTNRNLRIFKCVNGKIQLVPDSEISPAEKQKYLMYKNRYRSTKPTNCVLSTNLEKLLSGGLTMGRKRSGSEESQHERSTHDNDTSIVDDMQSDINNLSSLYGNISALTTNDSSTVAVNSSEKTPKLNSLLKMSVNKLNVIESKIINEGSLNKSTDTTSGLPILNDASKVASHVVSDKPVTVDLTNNKMMSIDYNEMTIEPVTAENGSPASLSNKYKNTYSRINTSRKLVSLHSEIKQPLLYRKQTVPKINYRYHTKDKLIISDKLPNNTPTVISVNNKNPNTVSVSKSTTGGINTKNIVIRADENVKNQQKVKSTPPVIRLNSSVNELKQSSRPRYLRNLINTVATSSAATINKSSTNVPSVVSLVKDKMSVSTSAISKTGENWEKLDRFAIDIERNQGESGLNSLMSQILEREVPVYKPVGTNEFYPCLECGDRFVFEASLREHKARKSVLIIYWCRTCSVCLNMYNRCMFLAHIRFHNQSFKNLDMTCLSVEPLPKNLLRLSSDIEPDSAADKQLPVSVTSDVTVSNSSTVTTSSSALISHPSFSSTGTSETCDQPSIVTTSTITAGGISKNNNQSGSVTLDPVPKTVYSDVGDRPTERNVDISSNSSSEVPADVIVLNEECASDSASSIEKNKDVISSNNDMEITVSNVPTTEVAKQQYNTIVSPTEKVDSEPASKKQVKGRRKCPECGIFITAKCSLRKHLQNFNRPLTDSLKCDLCQLILQSSCALKMHLRIHMKAKPFRCPECAIEFNSFDRFVMHLKYTCCHMTKVVRYICSVCSSMQTSAAYLEQHLLIRHVRSIFKCGSCPVAFINVKSAERHKEKEHPGRIVPTQSYQQCKLCPEKLIPKKRFLLHMKNHINDEKVRVYAYQCPTCEFTFFHRTELVYHRMKCDSRDGIIQSVLDCVQKPDMNGVSTMSTVPNPKNGVVEVEFITPNKKRKLSNEDEIELVQDEEKDPLSLEDFQMEEPLQEPVEETCIVCKTEKVLILPGRNQSSQSLCCKKCVRPCGVPHKSDQKHKLLAAKLKGYKCKICNSANYMDLKSIFVHFKSYHKELEGQSINEWLIIENSCVNNKKSNTFATAETIKEKYKKKRVLNSLNQMFVIKEEPNVDASDRKEFNAPEKKKPKKYIKFKQRMMVSEGKQFESGQIIETKESERTEFSCSMCGYADSNKEEFQDHVVSHRSDPNALQCLECGECFVVLPSLEKHLIISHGVSDVEKYINDNKQCMPLSERKESLDDDADDDSESGSKTCKVCREVFESKTALDKHFRSHGMAFLFKKP